MDRRQAIKLIGAAFAGGVLVNGAERLIAPSMTVVSRGGRIIARLNEPRPFTRTKCSQLESFSRELCRQTGRDDLVFTLHLDRGTTMDILIYSRDESFHQDLATGCFLRNGVQALEQSVMGYPIYSHHPNRDVGAFAEMRICPRSQVVSMIESPALSDIHQLV